MSADARVAGLARVPRGGPAGRARGQRRAHPGPVRRRQGGRVYAHVHAAVLAPGSRLEELLALGRLHGENGAAPLRCLTSGGGWISGVYRNRENVSLRYAWFIFRCMLVSACVVDKQLFVKLYITFLLTADINDWLDRAGGYIA